MRNNHKTKTATLLSTILAVLGQIYYKRHLNGISFIIMELTFIITCSNFINMGVCGISTLGTVPGVDHSIYLLVYGLISIIILGFAIMFYVFNVIDARKQAKLIAGGWEPPSIVQSIKEGYNKSF